MLNTSEMANLLNCSEARLIKNTKSYIDKITSLGYEKVGKGKNMMFGEVSSSIEKEEYLKMLELVDGNDTTLNNMLDVIEEVIELAGLEREINEGTKFVESDIEVLANRLDWSETKVKTYMKALQEANILKKINPKYYGIKHDGEWEQISFDTYDMITNQINKAIEGCKDPSYVRSLALAVHGYSNIRKLHGWTFTDNAIQSEEFMKSLLLALDYRKGVKDAK